jgi:hypothetical protein
VGKAYLHLGLALGSRLQSIAELGTLVLRAHLAEYLHHVLVPGSQLTRLASSLAGVFAGVVFGHVSTLG